MFEYGRKADYYRYLSEFKAGDDRNEAADQSLKAYEVCVSGNATLRVFALFYFSLPLSWFFSTSVYFPVLIFLCL